MELLLGIDIGSTSVKAIVYDLNGDVRAKASRPMRRSHPNPERPEWTVWDPEILWDETSAACRDAVSRLSDPADIVGMATTGMGMDGLPMGENGERLYPLISWHDPRTQPQYDWWVEKITVEKTFSIGGNPVWAINSALRMLWLRENEPALFDRTFKWLLIEDYVNYRFCGKFATDRSMASCTMLFDQRSGNWSEELCRLAGIPESILPAVHASGTRIGETTEEAAKQTGLRPGTPVYLGGHDHICSSLPIGAFRPGFLMCITGTWEMADMVASVPPLDVSLGRAGLTTQSHVVDGYMLWGGNPAGEMLEWYRGKAISNATQDWDVLVRMAEEAGPGSGGVLFLPHLGGASCPVIDSRSQGAFIGLKSRTTQAEMVRSLFEGLGYQFMDVVATMEAGTGGKTSEIIAVGGATRNAFWMQNKADMLGVNVIVPDIDEATALGAAILAGIGAGSYRDAEDAFRRIDRPFFRYEPHEERTRFYRDMLPLYRETYHALRPVHHKLFDRFTS